MKYWGYDYNGDPQEAGLILPDINLNVPDAGKLSVEISPGVFLNIWTSEWAWIEINSKRADELDADREKARLAEQERMSMSPDKAKRLLDERRK